MLNNKLRVALMGLLVLLLVCPAVLAEETTDITFLLADFEVGEPGANVTDYQGPKSPVMGRTLDSEEISLDYVINDGLLTVTSPKIKQLDIYSSNGSFYRILGDTIAASTEGDALIAVVDLEPTNELLEALTDPAMRLAVRVVGASAEYVIADDASEQILLTFPANIQDPILRLSVSDSRKLDADKIGEFEFDLTCSDSQAVTFQTTYGTVNGTMQLFDVDGARVFLATESAEN